MMKACIILCHVALLITYSLTAQPGGGGGISVRIILDKNNQPIPTGDTNFKIRTYLLSGQENPVITRQYTEAEKDRQYRYGGRSETRLYIPPYLEEAGGKAPSTNQCIELMYRGDTMVLECIGISAGNGAGRAELMDTLKLFSGYFRSFRTDSKRFITLWQQGIAERTERETLSRLMNNGITDFTIVTLFHYHILEQRRRVKDIILFKGDHTDTFPACHTPLYVLPLTNIHYGENSIYIAASDMPMIENEELLYRFVPDYNPTSILIFSEPDKKLREKAMKQEQQIKRFFNALHNQVLFINNQFYTGTIKIFYPFRSIGLEINALGYKLEVMRYKKGILIETNVLQDVDTEDEMPHPRLTMMKR